MSRLAAHLDISDWTVGQTTGALGLALLVAGLVHVILRVLALNRRRDELYAQLKNFPGAPGHWLWGNLNEVRDPSDFLRIALEWNTKYGAVRLARNGPWMWEVSLSSPEAVRAFMNTTEPKEPTLYGFLKPWIGDGLLLSHGQKWFRNRRLLTPAFHFEILKPYVHLFSHSANILVEKWNKSLDTSPNKSVEMFEHVSLMMLDSLLACAFGYQSHCQTESKRSPYIQAIYDLAELTTYRFTHPHIHSEFMFNLSMTGYNFRKACSMAHGFSRGVIKARKKQRESGIEEKKKYLDFLDILLEAKDADGKGLTDTEIQHEVDTFMFEGHDTTTSGLSWFLYNMARFPEHQQKCRDEILSVLGESESISWDNLHQMEYLTMCVKESMRIHPPVPNVGRHTTKPIPLPSGHTVPQGVWVTLSIYALHHNPDVWPNPETFNPQRFSPEEAKGRSSHAFVPFSAGPRNCIGQHFAMNEMKTCAAIILRNFELSVDKSIPIVLWPEIVLRSKHGIWLNLKRIQPS